MSPVEQALHSRLRRRAATLQPELARRLLAAYDLIRRSLTDAELVRAINAGSVDRMISELLADSTLDPAFAPLRALLDQDLIDAARMAAGDLPSRMQPPAFDVLNPRVIQAARDLDTHVITAMKTDVRETVRQHVISGLEAGRNPRTVAEGVREVLGLTPNQEKWVRNFRAELESGDRAALQRALGRGRLRTEAGTTITRASHAGGEGLSKSELARLDTRLGTEPLTPAQVNHAVRAYRNRLEAWGAESVTRTAALDAQKQGQRLSWEDAIERGIVDRERLRKVWVAVDDNRTRPAHAAMNGEEVGFDERFSNGQLVPGETDWNCRCVARVILARAAVAA